MMNNEGKISSSVLGRELLRATQKWLLTEIKPYWDLWQSVAESPKRARREVKRND